MFVVFFEDDVGFRFRELTTRNVNLIIHTVGTLFFRLPILRWFE